ncbi:MAG: phosphatase PAP2 family protein [Gemmatimonadota bacterium]|nr:MAG: phosphatase PAP2 family protein [Gemmatimonadota bacterium]
MTKKHHFRGPTIVQAARATHKSYRAFACLVLASLTPCFSTGWAQESGTQERASVGQILSVGASGVFTLLGRSLPFHQLPPDCAPCDPAGVPAFDRWAIHDHVGLYADMSDYLVLGLALGTWIDLAASEGTKAMLASMESAGWTMAVTELAKAFVGRKRPVMYTDRARDAMNERESLRSMPSGHTSIAFALATSYIVSTRDRDNKLPAILAGATALSVGVLRVAAGRHFPSDVAVGAFVGMGSVGVVHTIRF